MKKNLPANFSTHSGIFRAGLAASSLLLLLSCSKLDKDSNCLNDKAACFKADKTAPQFTQTVLPAPGVVVSTLGEVHLLFSEELNNPQPSDFTYSEPGLTVQSVSQIDKFTYRLVNNRNPTQGGPLTLSFTGLKDYAGNKITNGSITYTIDLTIPVTTTATRNGVSTGGYPSLAVSWYYQYTPTAAGNTVYHVRLTTGAEDCSAGTPITPTTATPVVNSAVQTYDATSPATISATTYNFSVDTTVIVAAGAQKILVCVDNANNNKHGIGIISIVRDDSAPVDTAVTLSPVAGNYISPAELTFACSDNADRIIYNLSSNVFSGTDPTAASVTDPVFNTTTGAIISGTQYNPASKPVTPYSGDTTRTIYKYRCIDKAGNISNIKTSGVYRINSTYPTVTLTSLTRTAAVPAVDITGVGAGGHTSATLQWSTNQAGQAWEIRSGGTDCGAGGTVVDSGSGGTATPSPANTPMFTTILHTSPGIADQTLNSLRVCVTNGSDWGQASLNLLRDDSAPVTQTVNIPGAAYGTAQNLVFSCSDNQDRVIYTESFSTPSGTPADPGDPQFDAAGRVTFGALHTGPLLITTDSTGLVGKKTTVKWRCIDKAGHIYTPASSATYTIDTLLPTVTVQSQDRIAISTQTGAYNASQITWTSDRSGSAYDIRFGSTNCTDGTVVTSGTNLSGGPVAANTPITTTINAVGTNLPGEANHTIHICVTNYANGKGYTTRSLRYDVTPPTLPVQTPTIAQVNATNFTVSWNASSDANGIAGYRIYRGTAPSTYPSFPGSPDYTAVSTSATVAMPDTNPYILKIVPFDVAGNVPAAGATYTEITTKPTIRIVLAGLASGTLPLTDGTSSNSIPNGTTNPWTTTLGAGSTYNFSITTQPAGQVCAMKELQFGTLNANLTLNINCVNGYTVGQNLNTVPATKLGYRLFQGKNAAIAGSGTDTFANGVGAAASFRYPEYIAHAAGFLYVSDTNNHVIRKIDLINNSVSVVAGVAPSPATTTYPGYADGGCLSARFNQPMGIFADGTNLYVADFVNGVIRKISDINGAGCSVTTLAGTGISGFADGAATVARFNNPRQLAGNKDHLFVADNSNHLIRRISLASGNVDTVIGNTATSADSPGTGTAARIVNPVGLALIGNTLYASSAQNRIMAIDVSNGAGYGVATIVAGNGSAGYVDGTGTGARFDGIYAMTTDGVDLYAVEVNNHLVRRVDVSQNYRVTTIAGAPINAGDATAATGVNARFNVPHGIATDGRSLYIANHTAHTIRKLSDNGLTGYWPLNGTTIDYSSGGNFVKTGVITGTVNATAGRYGEANGAYYFDGLQSSIGTPGGTQADTNFNSGNFSVAFWVKPAAVQQETSGNKDYDIVSNLSGQYDFAIRYHNEVSSAVTIPPNTPGQIIFIRYDGINTPYCLSGVRIDDGKFHHVAALKSGTKLSLYIDGKQVCTATDTVGAITLVGPPRIGARDSGTANDFTGAITDMRIYSRALNEGEINELAQDAGGTGQVGNGYSTGATGLLAHYEFTNGANLAASGPLGGTLGNSASYPIGKDGDAAGSAYFNGGSNLPGTPIGLPVGNAPRTMCAYMAPQSYPSATFAYAVAYGDIPAFSGFGIGIKDAGGGLYQIANTFSSGSDNLVTFRPPLNAWSHLCATYDGSVSRLYFNGAFMGSQPATLTTVLASFNIGSWLNNTQIMQGKIDDVRIYNNALSALQIRQLATQVPAGLLARYDFIGDGGDMAGWGQNMTSQTAVATVDRFGQSNAAYNFGPGKSMNRAVFSTEVSNVTLSSWVRWFGPNGFVQVIAHNGNTGNAGYGLMVDQASGRLHGLRAGLAAYDTGYTLPVNTWSHVAATIVSGTWTVYVNGAVVFTGGAPPQPITGADVFAIGMSSVASSQEFNGDIDDVRLYNRAVTAAEVRALAGYHPMQVTSWNTNAGASSMKFFLQPEAATYAAGGCSGGVNCVSAWKDSSGNNFNVAQGVGASQPVLDTSGINGKPAVKFVQSSATFLTGACAGDLNSANSTFFTVFKEGNQTGNNGIFQNGAQLAGKLLYFIYNPRRGPSLFDLGAGGAGLLNLWDSDLSVPFNASGESVIMSMDFNGTTGNLYKNGSAVTKSSQASAGYNCGSGALHIGRYYYGGAYPSDGGYFDGHLADFLFFNSILTGISVYSAPFTDREVVQCYLSSKYSIPLAGGAICP